jgi:hypothetical protein
VTRGRGEIDKKATKEGEKKIFLSRDKKKTSAIRHQG